MLDALILDIAYSVDAEGILNEMYHVILLHAIVNTYSII